MAWECLCVPEEELEEVPGEKEVHVDLYHQGEDASLGRCFRDIPPGRSLKMETRLRDYICLLAWVHLGKPREKPEEVTKESEV